MAYPGYPAYVGFCSLDCVVAYDMGFAPLRLRGKFCRVRTCPDPTKFSAISPQKTQLPKRFFAQDHSLQKRFFLPEYFMI